MPDAPLTKQEIEEALRQCDAAEVVWPGGTSTSESEEDSAARERWRIMAHRVLPRALRELLAAREDRAILAWLYANATHTTGTAGTGTPIMLPTRGAVEEAIKKGLYGR